MENKINWKNAILAGIAGTVLFDLAGLILTGQWWDIPALLGDKTGLGFAYGVVGHYSNGILLGILYAGIAPSLWGPNWLRPLTFMAAETIALVWFFMFPLLGAGVAGLNMDPMAPVGSMIRHLLFAVPFIFLIKVKN
ncbi:MAG: hypothetical protein KF775_12755 [Cyclobacteriaceae bacterium]|nr:hypothetical protein [Cyclobacteriaceae bacterium]